MPRARASAHCDPGHVTPDPQTTFEPDVASTRRLVSRPRKGDPPARRAWQNDKGRLQDRRRKPRRELPLPRRALGGNMRPDMRKLGRMDTAREQGQSCPLCSSRWYTWVAGTSKTGWLPTCAPRGRGGKGSLAAE